MRTLAILEYSGDRPPSEFYHEAVKRVWYCANLPEESRAALGPSALSLTGSEASDEAVFELLQSEAIEEDLLAVYHIGLLTAAGVGTSADIDTGVVWLTEAAEQGLPDAQYALGDMYAKGELVPADLAEALDWFGSAAELDFEDAQERIDALLEALVSLRAHADQGHADAQFRMGVMTWIGRAVARNEAQGLAWLEAAAGQGHEGARERVHFLVEALPALRRDATNGEPKAQFELARQLMLDEALPQDIPQAIIWLKRAARQGHNEACEFLGLATAWSDSHGLLHELQHEAELGEAWAIEALKHLPPGIE